MTLAKNRSTGNYDVGYGKPPEEGKFVKGQSGNPKGRPRKLADSQQATVSTSYSNVILADSKKTVGMRTSDGVEPITSLEAVLQATKAAALKGKTAAQRLYLQQVEQAQRKEDEQWAEICRIDRLKHEYYKTLVQNYEDQRDDGREYRAHPDDIIIDHKNKNVIFCGPCDWESYWLMVHCRIFRTELMNSISEWNKIEREDELKSYIDYRISAGYNSALLISELLPIRYRAISLEDFGITPFRQVTNSVDTIIFGAMMRVSPYHKNLLSAEPVAARKFIRADSFWCENQDPDYCLSPFFRPIDRITISGDAYRKAELPLSQATTSEQRRRLFYKINRDNSLPMYMRLNAGVALEQYKWQSEALILANFDRSLCVPRQNDLTGSVMLPQFG